jgi:hypothetical protein
VPIVLVLQGIHERNTSWFCKRAPVATQEVGNVSSNDVVLHVIEERARERTAKRTVDVEVGQRRVAAGGRQHDAELRNRVYVKVRVAEIKTLECCVGLQHCCYALDASTTAADLAPSQVQSLDCRVGRKRVGNGGNSPAGHVCTRELDHFKGAAANLGSNSIAVGVSHGSIREVKHPVGPTVQHACARACELERVSELESEFV